MLSTTTLTARRNWLVPRLRRRSPGKKALKEEQEKRTVAKLRIERAVYPVTEGPFTDWVFARPKQFTLAELLSPAVLHEVANDRRRLTELYEMVASTLPQGSLSTAALSKGHSVASPEGKDAMQKKLTELTMAYVKEQVDVSFKELEASVNSICLQDKIDRHENEIENALDAMHQATLQIGVQALGLPANPPPYDVASSPQMSVEDRAQWEEFQRFKAQQAANQAANRARVMNIGKTEARNPGILPDGFHANYRGNAVRTEGTIDEFCQAAQVLNIDRSLSKEMVESNHGWVLRCEATQILNDIGRDKSVDELSRQATQMARIIKSKKQKQGKYCKCDFGHPHPRLHPETMLCDTCELAYWPEEERDRNNPAAPEVA